MRITAMLGHAQAASDAVQSATADIHSHSKPHALERAFIRHRRIFWIVIALAMLLSFNGQWRIGLDSANYRGLADSLANGRGYTFGAWAPHAVYPGLPFLLAGLQKICGTSVLVPCICMNLMAIATLWLIYALVRLRFAEWIAVAVVFCVGMNSLFIQLANELLTDMPFLLGLMIALYGWERMRMAQSVSGHHNGRGSEHHNGRGSEQHKGDSSGQFRRRGSGRIKWIGACVFGLLLAGSMRPTFWIVIAAWGIVSVIGLIVGPRKLSAISLLALASAFAIFMLADPRSHGVHPLHGLPEQQVLNILTEGPETFRVISGNDRHAVATTTSQILSEKLRYIVHDQLPTAFFGQRCAPLSILASVVLLASTLLLWRYPLWLALIWLTMLVTVLLSAEPRYYIMVLPLLALGWVLMLDRILHWIPNAWGTVLAYALLVLVVGNNISRIVPIIIEQRAHPFIDHYRKGEYVPMIALAEQIRQNVPPDGNVLGPSGSVLSYFSGRHVWTQRELFAHVHEIDYPSKLLSMNFVAGVFPTRLYWDKEPTIARLMQKRIIVAVHPLFSTEKLSLDNLEIRAPDNDWRQLPKPPPHVVHVKHKHKKRRPVTAPATTQPVSTKP